MNNLKNAVGLLNAQAPKGEFLAYINPNEAQMLKDAGGSGLLTPQGIPSYFTAAQAATGGAAGGQAMSPGTSTTGGSRNTGGGNNNNNNNNDNNQTNKPPIVIEEPTFTGEDYDTTNTFEKPENKIKTFFGDIKDYVMSGGVIGNATRLIEKLGSPIQKKMMTYSLNKRIDKISNAKDFSPGAYGYKIQDLQKDLQGVQDGTFSQNDFTKKYGSGDVTNPNDKAYGTNPSALRENDIADIETYFAPELANIIGNTPMQDSMVNEYFANTNNQNLGISSDYMTTYNKAKEDLSKTLNMTTNANQFGYSGTMTASNIYYNYLKEQGLL